MKLKLTFYSACLAIGLGACAESPAPYPKPKNVSSNSNVEPTEKHSKPDVSIDGENRAPESMVSTPINSATPVKKPTITQETPKAPASSTVVTDPGSEGDGDFVIGPTYIAAEDTQVKANVAKGLIRPFTMKSVDSKIYRGQDSYLKEKGDFSRLGWLYVPAGYKDGDELPFILVGDGSWNQHKDLLSRTLDNLIAAKKLPAMAAIFIQPGPLGGGDGPGSQRSFEYDSVNDTFAGWVETEVLPKLTTEFKVKFTSDPEGRAAMGGSSSGAMAFTMAWFRPDLYHRVLTYSGTFVNRIQTTEHPQGAWEYHQSMIGSSPKKPLRIAIHASENDLNFGPDNNWLLANQNMAKILKEKGYHYRFLYSKNSGHIDGKVYGHTLPENLLWLWRGYPIK
ncbi:MAG: hypothetical protein H7318_18065 [Oligoflexus sp.]|nr:hypothetical protein [Oligoflexus sp.]